MHGELRKMLQATSFVAFTIVMSDGTHITVKHPENALLMKHGIYVATDGGETAWIRHGAVQWTSGLGYNPACFEANTKALLDAG